MRYCSAFLARRRHTLEHWLSAVLLRPDVGGCEAGVRAIFVTLLLRLSSRIFVTLMGTCEFSLHWHVFGKVRELFVTQQLLSASQSDGRQQCGEHGWLGFG